MLCIYNLQLASSLLLAFVFCSLGFGIEEVEPEMKIKGRLVLGNQQLFTVPGHQVRVKAAA